MLCAKCRKNQATKTYEQMRKGKKEVSYYCLDCYHKSFLCDEENSLAFVYSACSYCGTTAEEIAVFCDGLGFDKRDFIFALNVFEELGLVAFQDGRLTVYRGIKAELSDSPIYRKVCLLQQG